MPIKTIEELKSEIASLADQYKQALLNQTQKMLEVERLEQEISKLKKSLEIETTPASEVEGIDEDTALLDLETELERLKLKLSHTEYSVELEARKTTEKVTESTIKAIVGTDAEVYKLREQLINDQANLKAKKSELKRQQQERREKDRLTRWQTKSMPDNQELMDLEEQLFKATSEQYSANDEVELLKFKLESYKLLTNLENLT